MKDKPVEKRNECCNKCLGSYGFGADNWGCIEKGCPCHTPVDKCTSEKKIRTFIYYRESALQSIVSDIVSFVMLALAMAVNHFYFGDSKWWTLVLFGMFLLTLLGKGSGNRKDFTDIKSLKAFVNTL